MPPESVESTVIVLSKPLICLFDGGDNGVCGTPNSSTARWPDRYRACCIERKHAGSCLQIGGHPFEHPKRPPWPAAQMAKSGTGSRGGRFPTTVATSVKTPGSSGFRCPTDNGDHASVHGQ